MYLCRPPSPRPRRGIRNRCGLARASAFPPVSSLMWYILGSALGLAFLEYRSCAKRKTCPESTTVLSMRTYTPTVLKQTCVTPCIGAGRPRSPRWHPIAHSEWRRRFRRRGPEAVWRAWSHLHRSMPGANLMLFNDFMRSTAMILPSDGD